MYAPVSQVTLMALCQMRDADSDVWAQTGNTARKPPGGKHKAGIAKQTPFARRAGVPVATLLP